MMDACLDKVKALCQMLGKAHLQLTLNDFKEALSSLTGRITHFPIDAMEKLLAFFENGDIKRKCMLIAFDHWVTKGVVLHRKGGLQMQRVELIKAITYGVYKRQDITIDWEKVEPKPKPEPSFLEQALAMEGSKVDPSPDATVHFLSSEEDLESHACIEFCFHVKHDDEEVEQGDDGNVKHEDDGQVDQGEDEELE